MALGREYLGMKGYVCFAARGHYVMRNIRQFSAQLYRVCAMSMLLCFQSVYNERIPVER